MRLIVAKHDVVSSGGIEAFSQRNQRTPDAQKAGIFETSSTVVPSAVGVRPSLDWSLTVAFIDCRRISLLPLVRAVNRGSVMSSPTPASKPLPAEDATDAPAAASSKTSAPAAPARRTAPAQREQPKFLPPHAIVLHNDDHNGMDHVVAALMSVFHYSTLKSIKLMLEVHFSGRAIIWTGSLEVAELKVEQLLGVGADPRRLQYGAGKLRVSIEPMPE
jgi:ATP-dependent Clp protease adaptor protein ClpS